jgi:hypothetical protein
MEFQNKTALVTGAASGMALLFCQCFVKEGGNAVFHLITREEPKSLSQNSFEINGRKIIFDESLGFSYEEINCDSVELRSLPKAWKTDKLWRVMLELDKIEANKETTLSTVVE